MRIGVVEDARTFGFLTLTVPFDPGASAIRTDLPDVRPFGRWIQRRLGGRDSAEFSTDVATTSGLEKTTLPICSVSCSSHRWTVRYNSNATLLHERIRRHHRVLSDEVEHSVTMDVYTQDITEMKRNAHSRIVGQFMDVPGVGDDE